MSDFKKYHCLECEHIYDEEKGAYHSRIDRKPAGRTFTIAGIGRYGAPQEVFSTGGIKNDT
jgi:hypothetical protein